MQSVTDKPLSFQSTESLANADRNEDSTKPENEETNNSDKETTEEIKEPEAKKEVKLGPVEEEEGNKIEN